MLNPVLDQRVLLVRQADDDSWIVQRVGGPAFDSQSKFRGPKPGHISSYIYAQTYETEADAMERAREIQEHHSIPIFTMKEDVPE